MLDTSIRKRLAQGLVVMLSTVGMVVVGPTVAHADPVCQSNGAYVLFARGSGAPIGSAQGNSFRSEITNALHSKGIPNVEWAELGNLDGSVPSDGQHVPDASYEYPAVPIDPPNNSHNLIDGGYNNSVTIGKNELVTHLNDRYAGNGPRDNGSCTTETLVLGGYSQGADVVGWALQSSELSQAAKNHMGFVALYGDPKFNPGTLTERLQKVNFQSTWWWVRGNDAGYRYRGVSRVRNSGMLEARTPYVPEEFKGRFGSWCTDHDAFCSGIFPWGVDVHTNSYQDYWIHDSAAEIAYVAKQKHDQLSAGQENGAVTSSVTSPPTSAPASYYDDNMNPVPPPTILQVQRSLAPDGTTHEVYAATNSTVTEGWWQPGGDGVHTDEIINISQGNIVGIDKVNQPDGVTQSLYTAVPDGVWETYWRAGVSPQSAKIVSGLNGVRQVIVANAYEGSQFVHRLYLLAQDGPYEAWWKDGGDGVHVDRLNNITGGVAMAAGTGPDGAYEVFVATPTWVYQLWWFPGGTVNYRTILNVTQGDIRSLSMGANLNGGQLLYTGTSTTAWQSWWLGDNGAISTGTITVGQTNAGEIEKDVYAGTHELYQTNGGRVQENWWNGSGSGSDTLITISQGNITSFDKSNDGAYQQVYTASGNLVYETWWAAGVNPSSSVLFSVTR